MKKKKTTYQRLQLPMFTYPKIFACPTFCPYLLTYLCMGSNVRELMSVPRRSIYSDSYKHMENEGEHRLLPAREYHFLTINR